MGKEGRQEERKRAVVVEEVRISWTGDGKAVWEEKEKDIKQGKKGNF